MEITNDTTPVFIGAGENRVSLTPLKGTWTYNKKEVPLYVNVPNGAREFIVQALGKTTKVDEKGNVVTTNANVIIWNMPNNLKVIGKSSTGQWRFTVTITDEMLESWMDMIIENVRPKGAVSEKNEPVISNAQARLQAKLNKLGTVSNIDNDELNL